MADIYDLSYFMKKHETEYKFIPAPPCIGDNGKDKNGNRIMLKIKKLTQEDIEAIVDKYSDTVIAFDKKGNPYIANGKIVMKDKKDNKATALEYMLQGLVEPNLRDEKLREFYGVTENIHVPLKVFPNKECFDYVNREILKFAGILDDPNEEENKNEEEKEIEAVKNE